MIMIIIRIQEIKQKILANDKNIESVFNTHLLNFDYNAKYTYYEVELKNMKHVLIDLSVLLGYDLEPCREIINLKHSHLNGVSYPIFKECLYDYLDKKDIKLSTMFYVEQTSIPIEQLPKNEDEANEILDTNNKELLVQSMNGDGIKETVTLTNDVSLLISHRSLFILKKKFDNYKQDIKKIYKEYSEESVDDYLVDINNFLRIAEEVMMTGKFMLLKIRDFEDLTQKEMEYVKNVTIDMDLMDKLSNFAFDNRRKYNLIYRDKRTKKRFRLEDYKDYTPIGEDELTKLCYEQVEVEEELYDPFQPEEEDKIEEANDVKSELTIKPQEEGIEIEKEEENNEDDIVNTGEVINDKNNTKPKPKGKKESYTTLPLPMQSGITSLDYQSDLNPQSHLENHQSTKTRHTKKVTRAYQKSFMFIETLPLILADFLTTSPDYAICDLDDDIRENLRTLFDNEILQRLGDQQSTQINQYKTEKLKELLFATAKAEKNISFFEDLYNRKKAQRENVAFISNTLEKLYTNKKWLDDKIKRVQEDNDTFNEYENSLYEKAQIESLTQANNTINSKARISSNKNIMNNNQGNKSHNHHQSNDIDLSIIERNPEDKSIILSDAQKTILSYNKIIPKKLLSKEELRNNALKEIFYFYSRQHSTITKQTTFDSMKQKMDNLDLSEFSRFCVEFKILVTKEKLVELFKKNTSNTKQMSFEEFNISLQKISLAINEEKKRLIKRRMIHLKNILETNRKLEEKQTHPDHLVEPTTNLINAGNITLLKANQINEEINNCKVDLEKLNKKTYQQLLDELYLYMDIDKEEVYREKMKGFSLPFLNKLKQNMKTLPKIAVHNAKTLDKKTAKEIHQMIEERKKEINEQKELQWKIKGVNLAYQKKVYLGDINKRIDNEKPITLTMKEQKEIRELQRKAKERDQKELQAKMQKMYQQSQNESLNKIRQDEEHKDIPIQNNNDKLVKGYNNNDGNDGEVYGYSNYKNPAEIEKENLDKLLSIKNTNKVGNKFTWNSLDSIQASQLINPDEILQYIESPPIKESN